MIERLVMYAGYQTWLLEEIVYATNQTRHLESLANNRRGLRRIYEELSVPLPGSQG